MSTIYFYIKNFEQFHPTIQALVYALSIAILALIYMVGFGKWW